MKIHHQVCIISYGIYAICYAFTAISALADCLLIFSVQSCYLLVGFLLCKYYSEGDITVLLNCTLTV